jgi:hypothetical protein
MTEGIRRWEAEKLELGQLVWTLERDKRGVEIRELVFVMATERTIVATRKTYTSEQSLISLPFKDVFIDRDHAVHEARSQQRWYLDRLESTLNDAKRHWNSYYAETPDQRYTVEEEDFY